MKHEYNKILPVGSAEHITAKAKIEKQRTFMVIAKSKR